MSIQEIKAQLHQIIDKAEDAKFLEQIIKVMEVELEGKHSTNTLSPEQKERLHQSWQESQDIDSCIPHDQIKNEAAKWGK